MKRMLWMMVVATIVAVAVSCGSKKKEEAPKPKVLVLYYSQTSNTKTVAQEIATRLGADIEEIVPVDPYEGDFQATISRCMEERELGLIPELKVLKADLSKYDVVFLGYPVWFGTFAPPVGAFLDKNDLSGKKVVPFCTFGSGGLDSSVKDLAERQPNAEILPGYGVRAARMAAVPNEVDQFLKAGGFIEGEYTKLEAFAGQHEVSDDEAAIFNAAVGDYPMIHAQAKTVATRSIPGGTEYLFTAEDQQRQEAKLPPMPEKRKRGLRNTNEEEEKKPDMPKPNTQIQVYVTVANGEEPVFTQVVR